MNDNSRTTQLAGSGEQRDVFGLTDILANAPAAAAGAVVGREIVKQTGQTIREKMRLDAKSKPDRKK